MNYIYHDDMDYGEECTPIIESRESKWLGLIQRFETSYDSWTEEEIEDVIQEIQEYILLDYPEEKNHSIKQLRDALDGVARVTLMLFRTCNGHQAFDRSYATKKLYAVLKDLQPKVATLGLAPTPPVSQLKRIERTTPRISIRGKSI